MNIEQQFYKYQLLNISIYSQQKKLTQLINIENQEINLDAELFSIDGSECYNTKKSKPFKFAKDLGNEVGKNLKKRSNNSYKK